MDREFFLLSLCLFLLSLHLSLFITPLARQFSLRKRYSDRKDDRTVHSRTITRLGGIAIFISISLNLVFLALMGKLQPEITAILSGISIIFLIGIADDIKPMSSYLKLAAQLAACYVVLHSGFRIRMFTMPFMETSIQLPIAVSYILTVLWLLLITNAFNFIDGLDGLAAGISVIVAVSLFGISIRTKRFDIALPFLAVAGSCLGFLRYNFHPAKIFMGDAGSTTIGFTLACLTLFGTIKAPAVFPLLVPLIALGIPATDLCMAVARRLKRGRNPFFPDKKHLHHKLMATGFHHRDAVLILYGVTIILGVLAYTFTPGPSLATSGFAITATGMVTIAIRRIFARKKSASA